MTPEEQLMKTVIEAWGEADVGPVREALDENVIWKSASSCDNGTFRFGGVYLGRANVLTLLSTLSTSYFFRRYVAKEIVSRGEIVWGLFDVDGSYVPPGVHEIERKLIQFEIAFRWRIHNGKILEAQSFFDTAALLIQQRELPVGVA